MRSLTINEMNEVSGGAGEFLIGTLFVLGVTSLLYWTASPSKDCSTYYTEVVSYREVETPFVDAYGNPGVFVDTIRDVTYKPVTLCI